MDVKSSLSPSVRKWVVFPFYNLQNEEVILKEAHSLICNSKGPYGRCNGIQLQWDEWLMDKILECPTTWEEELPFRKPAIEVEEVKKSEEFDPFIDGVLRANQSVAGDDMEVEFWKSLWTVRKGVGEASFALRREWKSALMESKYYDFNTSNVYCDYSTEEISNNKGFFLPNEDQLIEIKQWIKDMKETSNFIIRAKRKHKNKNIKGKNKKEETQTEMQRDFNEVEGGDEPWKVLFRHYVDRIRWVRRCENKVHLYEMIFEILCGSPFLGLGLLICYLERALGDFLFWRLKGSKVAPRRINELLKTPELAKMCFTEDIIFLLKLFVGPPCALNLRNLVWHGFLHSEHEYKEANEIYDENHCSIDMDHFEKYPEVQFQLVDFLLVFVASIGDFFVPEEFLLWDGTMKKLNPKLAAEEETMNMSPKARQHYRSVGRFTSAPNGGWGRTPEHVHAKYFGCACTYCSSVELHFVGDLSPAGHLDPPGGPFVDYSAQCKPYNSPMPPTMFYSIREEDVRHIGDLFEESSFVISNRVELWKEALENWAIGRYNCMLTVLLPQLEHAIRMVFTQANNCPERILCAEPRTYYTTMEILLSPFVGLSLEDNKLMNVLTPSTILLLYDLFTWFQGPHLRDKLAHGALHLDALDCPLHRFIPDLVVSVAVGISASLLESDSDTASIKTPVIQQCVNYIDTYEPYFHPLACLEREILHPLSLLDRIGDLLRPITAGEHRNNNSKTRKNDPLPAHYTTFPAPLKHLQTLQKASKQRYTEYYMKKMGVEKDSPELDNIESLFSLLYDEVSDSYVINKGMVIHTDVDIDLTQGNLSTTTHRHKFRPFYFPKKDPHLPESARTDIAFMREICNQCALLCEEILERYFEVYSRIKARKAPSAHRHRFSKLQKIMPAIIWIGALILSIVEACTLQLVLGRNEKGEEISYRKELENKREGLAQSLMEGTFNAMTNETSVTIKQKKRSFLGRILDLVSHLIGEARTNSWNTVARTFLVWVDKEHPRGELSKHDMNLFSGRLSMIKTETVLFSS